MYAMLFKPRTLVPSYPKLDIHTSIQVSRKLDTRDVGGNLTNAHPPHSHASSPAGPKKMAVEQTLSEEEDADEASPPSVGLTSGFEKAMLKLKKIQATQYFSLVFYGIYAGANGIQFL